MAVLDDAVDDDEEVAVDELVAETVMTNSRSRHRGRRPTAWDGCDRDVVWR
jgi:hypothetical protein